MIERTHSDGLMLPRPLQKTFSPDELAFIAESTTVEIMPLKAMAGLDLITVK